MHCCLLHLPNYTLLGGDSKDCQIECRRLPNMSALGHKILSTKKLQSCCALRTWAQGSIGREHLRHGKGDIFFLKTLHLESHNFLLRWWDPESFVDKELLVFGTCCVLEILGCPWLMKFEPSHLASQCIPPTRWYNQHVASLRAGRLPSQVPRCFMT